MRLGYNWRSFWLFWDGGFVAFGVEGAVDVFWGILYAGYWELREL